MIFGASRSRRPSSSSRSARLRAVEPVEPEELPPKLIPVIRQLISTGVSLAHTRLALAGIELEEEMQRLFTAAALAFVSVVFVFMALIVGTFTIIAAVPPESRVMTMIIVTVVYLALAIFAVLKLKGLFTNRPPIFAATLAELEKDKETLGSMSRAHEAAEEAREREREQRANDARRGVRTESTTTASAPQGAL